MGGAAGAALLLALILAPGLAYRVGREQRLPERKRRGAADSASSAVISASRIRYLTVSHVPVAA